MYTGLLHTHTLVVSLFLMIYLVKTILLFAKPTLLEPFSRKTRILEIIVSTLFLLTGVGMALQTPSINVGIWFWVKLIAVFASIPLAVIGFRKANKGLALLSMLLIVYAWGVSETRSPRMKKSDYFGSLGPAEALVDVNTERASEQYDPVPHGKALYTFYCVACHGSDGALGVAGAKNLAHSTLDRDATKSFIRKGKNAMPGFGSDVLTEDELDALVAYLKVEMAAEHHPH
ncbi:MAG: hypothetical protein RLZZ335_309 [Bacteroidota bacterium]|jgi:uncharacterized membrane protein SirB2/cytochrome c5